MTTDRVTLKLLPLGRSVEVERGESLQDVLFEHGVEFPCGGRGRCKGCKIKVLSGNLPVGADDREKLSVAELEAGWRLACRATAEADLVVELAQWEAAILADDSAFAFTPQAGLGIAIDLGTTTLVGQLIDLESGQVLAVETALNAQARHGADVMSRIEFAMADSGQRILEELIREQIAQLALELLEHVPGRELSRMVIVGNTVMHHLFSGITVEPLSHFPFEPQTSALQSFEARQLGWKLTGDPAIYFLPCLGGFVGSDILAGIIAARLQQSDSLVALLDLGTNGEIVVGNRERLLCASTAAGPAFEGARISMGMRAATGAVSEVHIEGDGVRCHVLGHSQPRGVCGSGLVDAVAAGLELGWLKPTGRLCDRTELVLAPPVTLNQRDIRELQLAKGAIAAGLSILLQQWGAGLEQVERVYVAGAFGNYINYHSARRIGLLKFPIEKVVAAGNTALLGAKIGLFVTDPKSLTYPEVLSKTTHLSLHEHPVFHDTYVEEMSFPLT